MSYFPPGENLKKNKLKTHPKKTLTKQINKQQQKKPHDNLKEIEILRVKVLDEEEILI